MGEEDASSLVRPKVVKSVHFCPATEKFTLREYRDITSNMGLPTGSVLSEAPFRPREVLFEKQKLFQSIHKHTFSSGKLLELPDLSIHYVLSKIPKGPLKTTKLASSC
ncbi:unnamed protein product [Fraxinus pennsylvanica]|uniref:Uncharacterized protein n=1 Tax=Fraxinus pennsylvanica TaxID=56036 RepID=A0AAD2E544_9LAMI|nr:unnamed protein product [Fraxinus pennsylvanica]